MSWLRSVSEFGRELRDMPAVVAEPADRRPFVVYAEDIASYKMVEGYLDGLRERHERSIVYVTSASDDPLLSEPPAGMSVHYVSKLLPSFMRRLDSRVLLTTMPDLAKLDIPRPPASCHCLYAFHSLNSIHEVYLEGAFDHYDSFFCTGPHHKRELEAHFHAFGMPQPELHEVGYHQLDRVYQSFQAYSAPETQRPTVLVAPSWGRGNLLEAAGVEIVGHLLAMGARVVVRPHPCFFLPIYPKGLQVVDRVEARWGSDPHFTLERDITSADSFLEADLMVSDFSGAAFEYALGTLRPVLFIDVARKTRNPNWRKLGLPTFEDTMRSQVGRILDADQIESCGSAAESLLGASDDFRQRLEALRSEVVYNFGHSGEVGADVIEDLLSREERV